MVALAGGRAQSRGGGAGVRDGGGGQGSRSGGGALWSGGAGEKEGLAKTAKEATRSMVRFVSRYVTYADVC